jgi:hypothetical protein
MSLFWTDLVRQKYDLMIHSPPGPLSISRPYLTTSTSYTMSQPMSCHPYRFPAFSFTIRPSFCLLTSKHEECGDAFSGYTKRAPLAAASSYVPDQFGLNLGRSRGTVKRIKSLHVHRDKWDSVGLTLFLFPCEWLP